MSMTQTQNSRTNRLGSVNWLQAITEVVLILVGIGLAVAADSWMDSRRERQEERQYLIGLREDLVETKEGLEQSLQQTEQTYDRKLSFIRALQGPSDALTEDELRELFSNIFQTYWSSGVFGTYQDMVSSGDLRLIRNEEIRIALAKFIDDWDTVLWMPIRESYQEWLQVLVPYMISNLNVTTVQLRGYRGQALPSDINYKFINREKVWSQEFENILAVTALGDIDQILNTRWMIDNANTILALIDEELAR